MGISSSNSSHLSASQTKASISRTSKKKTDHSDTNVVDDTINSNEVIEPHPKKHKTSTEQDNQTVEANGKQQKKNGESGLSNKEPEISISASHISKVVSSLQQQRSQYIIGCWLTLENASHIWSVKTHCGSKILEICFVSEQEQPSFQVKMKDSNYRHLNEFLTGTTVHATAAPIFYAINGDKQKAKKKKEIQHPELIDLFRTITTGYGLTLSNSKAEKDFEKLYHTKQSKIIMLNENLAIEPAKFYKKIADIIDFVHKWSNLFPQLHLNPNINKLFAVCLYAHIVGPDYQTTFQPFLESDPEVACLLENADSANVPENADTKKKNGQKKFQHGG